jgi:DNA replication licensing factor MCM5
MEAGVGQALDTLVAPDAKAEAGGQLPHIQVLFTGDLIPTQIRDVSAQDVNRLVLVPGIVINASRTRPKATRLHIRCSNCGSSRDIPAPGGLGSVTLPRTCSAL